MNYLFHAYLSDPSPDCLLGNLMGDFVKGPLDDRWPPEIALGIRQHRGVDSFAQNSPIFRRSKGRLDDRFGYFRGILVDIFYDHLLARNWNDYCRHPLEKFAAELYELLEQNHDRLPEPFKPVASRMSRHDWLGAYRHAEVIERVLERIGARLKRPNPLAQGAGELHRHYRGLERDCHEFIEAARIFLDKTRV